MKMSYYSCERYHQYDGFVLVGNSSPQRRWWPTYSSYERVWSMCMTMNQTPTLGFLPCWTSSFAFISFLWLSLLQRTFGPSETYTTFHQMQPRTANRGPFRYWTLSSSTMWLMKPWPVSNQSWYSPCVDQCPSGSSWLNLAINALVCM